MKYYEYRGKLYSFDDEELEIKFREFVDANKVELIHNQKIIDFKSLYVVDISKEGKIYYCSNQIMNSKEHILSIVIGRQEGISNGAQYIVNATDCEDAIKQVKDMIQS